MPAAHLKRLEAAIRTADRVIEKLGIVKDGAQAAITGLVGAAKPIADELKALRVGPWVSTGNPARVAVHVARTARPETVRALGQVVRVTARAGSILPAGEARVLTAIAQHADGVTREQLTILTGYRRSTRDAYLQRLRERDAITIDRDRIQASATGLSALGPTFAPLPTGDGLRVYWLDRLPEGERRVLEVAIDSYSYPKAVDRDAISEITGYKRSTRDAYLQRLGARRLVELERGAVRARAELFG